jgi:hypothetical protein
MRAANGDADRAFRVPSEARFLGLLSLPSMSRDATIVLACNTQHASLITHHGICQELPDKPRQEMALGRWRDSLFIPHPSAFIL